MNCNADKGSKKGRKEEGNKGIKTHKVILNWEYPIKILVSLSTNS
jgi:hypothetical protein